VNSASTTAVGEDGAAKERDLHLSWTAAHLPHRDLGRVTQGIVIARNNPINP
jgi:hypothetical protein